MFIINCKPSSWSILMKYYSYDIDGDKRQHSGSVILCTWAETINVHSLHAWQPIIQMFLFSCVLLFYNDQTQWNGLIGPYELEISIALICADAECECPVWSRWNWCLTTFYLNYWILKSCWMWMILIILLTSVKRRGLSIGLLPTTP